MRRSKSCGPIGRRSLPPSDELFDISAQVKIDVDATGLHAWVKRAEKWGQAPGPLTPCPSSPGPSGAVSQSPFSGPVRKPSVNRSDRAQATRMWRGK